MPSHPQTVLEHDAILSIDNALSRKRLLALVIKEVRIPKAAYDFVKSTYRDVDGIHHVSFKFFLPVTRRVKRQSVILGNDFTLIVNLWVVPLILTDKILVVDNNPYVRNDLHEIHVIAPIKEDRVGTLW